MTDGAVRAHERACVPGAATAWSYYAHPWMRSPQAFAWALARTRTRSHVRLQPRSRQRQRVSRDACFGLPSSPDRHYRSSQACLCMLSVRVLLPWLSCRHMPSVGDPSWQPGMPAHALRRALSWWVSRVYIPTSVSALGCNASRFAVVASSATPASSRPGQRLPQRGKARRFQLAVLHQLRPRSRQRHREHHAKVTTTIATTTPRTQRRQPRR
jgi:hypothetical protein